MLSQRTLRIKKPTKYVEEHDLDNSEDEVADKDPDFVAKIEDHAEEEESDKENSEVAAKRKKRKLNVALEESDEEYEENSSVSTPADISVVESRLSKMEEDLRDRAKAKRVEQEARAEEEYRSLLSGISTTTTPKPKRKCKDSYYIFSVSVIFPHVP